ncbi:MAG: DUF6785 family protein [Armatimonadota bacterium]|nr:DUF6785 family protein [Armatimonadota bacterium]
MSALALDTPSSTDEQVVAEAEERAGLSGVTARAVIVGLIMVVFFTVVGCFGVFLRYEIIGTGYLPRGAVCILLALIGANAAMRLIGRVTRRLRLNARELLLVFLMLLVVGAIAGQEFAQHVYLNLLGIVYYATPDIAPPELYLEDLNPMLVPDTAPEAAAVRWAYEGLPPGRSVPWRAWVTPLLVWTPFFFAIYWMVLCFMTALAHRWEREERLLYPLVQVPVEVVEGEPSGAAELMHSPLMWIAFASACILYSIKGLHAYWPAIPDIQLQETIRTTLGGPWSAFNNIPRHLYPEMVGIAYLLTAEVGFSLWFFWWFQRIQQFVRIAVGVDVGHYQFFEFQTIGGYAVLAGALLWSARDHLRKAVGVAFGTVRRRPEAADADEPYRLSVLGFLGAFAFIVWWCSYVGMDTLWAIVQYAAFPLVGMVVARVVCEAGMFIYSSPFRLNEAIFEIAGTERVGAHNIALMTATSWTQIRSTATMNMAAVAQGLKVGAEMKAHRAQIVLVAMLAVIVAILCSHVTSLYVIYNWSVPKLGWWPSGSGLNTTTRLARYLQTPSAMGLADWIGLALGAGLTWSLVALRRRFVWWPLHPLGYVAWLGWPISRYWMSIFIGWLWKVTVVKFGGFRAFNRLRPLAFGLILGVSVILTFWIVVHYFFPAPSLVVE